MAVTAAAVVGDVPGPLRGPEGAESRPFSSSSSESVEDELFWCRSRAD